MKTKRAPFGTPERIAQCKRHRPAQVLDMVTGKPTGKLGCFLCGAAIALADPTPTEETL